MERCIWTRHAGNSLSASGGSWLDASAFHAYRCAPCTVHQASSLADLALCQSMLDVRLLQLEAPNPNPNSNTQLAWLMHGEAVHHVQDLPTRSAFLIHFVETKVSGIPAPARTPSL